MGKRLIRSARDSSTVEREIVFALVHFAGAQVLEIGGGDGRLTKHFAPISQHTTLIDTDLSELTTAREELSVCEPGKVELHNARAENLPYADESFDIVLFSWSL